MDNFKPISQPMEMPRSADYRVTVGGVPVAVIEVPRPQERIAEEKRFEYAYAAFEADAETIVEVEAIADDLQMSDPCVLPDSLGAKCERLSPSKARFALKAPCTAVFEANGRHRALVIAAMKPDADAPAEGDPKVIFVRPGLHRRDLTVVGEGETLYLAPGAVLEGAVLVEGDDARVCGHGIVSGVPWPWQNGPKVEGKANFSGHMMLVKGKRVEVRDIALLSSWGWTLVVSDTEDTRIDGVKILGGRVINDDGIDICKSRRTTIRNCFVRCQDDCIAPKWWYEDLTVESCTLWTDVANIFRVGYECSEAPTRSHGIVFRDIDILHTTLEASETTSYWANCLICIQASNGHVIENVLFDDIRIHEIGRWDIFLLVKTMPISVFFDFPESGTIRGITFRDIHLPAGEFKAPIRLESHDPEHTVSGIRFDGVDGYGKVEIVGKTSDVNL